MNCLKDCEIRELQLFPSENTLLLPYLDKFVSENITRSLLIKADDIFLKIIKEKFEMKLGEYGALLILIKNFSSRSPLQSKMKKHFIGDSIRTQSPSSAEISVQMTKVEKPLTVQPCQSTTTVAKDLPTKTEIAVSTVLSVPSVPSERALDTDVSAASTIEEEKSQLVNLSNNSLDKEGNGEGSELTEEYKDNTKTHFKIGKLS